MKKNIFFLLILILLFTSCIFYFLQKKNLIESSKITINENIPKFNTVSLINNNQKLTNHDIIDKITLINFFASWCLPCKSEHKLLMNIKNNFPELIIIGFNYKDNNKDALKFLSENGNPYNLIGIDQNGEIGLKFGVFGLPETFLTNNSGQIIYKKTGALSHEIIKKEIMPKL